MAVIDPPSVSHTGNSSKDFIADVAAFRAARAAQARPPNSPPPDTFTTPTYNAGVTYDALGNPQGGSAAFPLASGSSATVAPVPGSGGGNVVITDATKYPPSLSAQVQGPAAPLPDHVSEVTSTQSVETGGDVDAINKLRDGLLDLNTFDPNLLSTYDNTAYHFRFFMTPNIDIVKSGGVKQGSTTALHDALSKVSTVTIAESGVTGFNIKDVQIEAVVGPTMQARNANATKVIMTIIEPMGTNLFDRIFAAAQKLHIKNYAKMYYYLELSFKGYDATYGTVDNNLCGRFGNGGIWIYQLFINNIETNLEAGGTTYTITAIPTNESALEDEIMRLPDNISTPAVSIGDSIAILKRKLNDTTKERYAGYQLYEYAFELHDIITNKRKFDSPGTFNLSVETRKDNIRSHNMNTVDGAAGKIVAHFQRGSTIADCIETLYANSVLGQYLVKDVGKPDSLTGGKTAQDRFRESVVFRVEPDVTVGDFDPITLLYQKKVTFHVWAYTTQLPILDINQILASRDDAVQFAMVNKMKSDGFLTKRYDYLFTGLNTEVLNIDLRYNLTWSAVLPKFEGMLNGYDQLSDVGATRNSNITEGRTLNYYFGQDQARLAMLKNQNAVLQHIATDGLEGLTDDEKRVLAGQTFPNDLRKRLSDPETQKKLAKEILGNNEAEIKGVDGLQARTDSLQQQVQAKRVAEQAANAASDQKAGLTTISDASVAASFAEDLELATTPSDDPPIPISIQQANDDPRNQVTGPLTGSYHRDVSIYGAVLNQLYGPMTQQLINISLEIKGDPYWIGPSNLDRRFILNSTQEQATLLKRNFPDFTTGDNCFLLSFRYPQGIDEAKNDGQQHSEGAPIFRQQEQFDGIYAIRKVTHSFSNGLFKQTIDALRMPLIDILKSFGLKVPGDQTTNKGSAPTSNPVVTPTQTATNPAAAPAPSFANVDANGNQLGG